MEKYKAVSNNSNVIENDKNENLKSTEKVVNLAAETALDSVTAGQGSKIKKGLEKVPVMGNQVSKTWNNAVKNVSEKVSNTPLGNIARRADKSGVVDTARGVKDAMNGSIPNNDSKSNSREQSGTSNSKLLSFGNKLNKASSFDGDLLKMIPRPLKIKLIICCSAVFVFLLMVIAVFADADLKNLELTNGNSTAQNSQKTVDEIKKEIKEISVDELVSGLDSSYIYAIKITENNADEEINKIKEFIGSNSINYYVLKTGNEEINKKLEESFDDKIVDDVDKLANNIYESQSSGGLRSGNPENALQVVANWFIGNAGDYNQNKSISNPYPNKTSRLDCSGFVATYMSYVGDCDLGNPDTGTMIGINGSWSKKAMSCGWKGYNSSSLSELQPGDVMVGGSHTEVYVDANHTFGWGRKRSEYPLSNITIKQSDGSYKDYITNYTTIYRYEGNSSQ